MTVVTRPTTETRSAVVLLPPSEGKAIGGGNPSWSPDLGAFGALLDDRRSELVTELRAVDGGDQRLLGVSGRHLERARDANAGLLGAPTLPAWQRYTGVVWDHLDPGSLTAARRRRIIVGSGLHGLVRGDDPIPDYRLKMGGRLASLGTISRWWRPVLADVLRATTRRATVIDLLPSEHRQAFTEADRAGWVVVDLVERSGRAGGHAAKAAKGRLARHLLNSSGPVDEVIAGWDDDRFDALVTVPD